MSDERYTERPRPQYGEYAPEGWEPPSADPAAPEVSATQGGPAPGGSRRAPVNVPHNLGVGNASSPDTPGQSSGNAPAPSGGGPSGTAPGALPPSRGSGSTADRIITIVLLILGALGALQFALAMLTLGNQLEIIAVTLGAEELEIPASITVLQSVGTITMLSIYAIALIWSVQRLRARKLAFWVPLAAGLLALILLFVFVIIALTLVPELLEFYTPDKANLLFEQLGGLS